MYICKSLQVGGSASLPGHAADDGPAFLPEYKNGLPRTGVMIYCVYHEESLEDWNFTIIFYLIHNNVYICGG